MIGSALNNLNALNDAVIQAADTQLSGIGAAFNGMDSSLADDFNNILDKTIEQSDSLTLGDMKDISLNGDMFEALQAFKDVLFQTTREVNMENSLDLTLARDITEIISQLKSAINTEADTDIEEDTEQDSSVTFQNQQTDETDCKEPVNEDGVIPLFAQILNITNNIQSKAVSDNSLNVNADCDDSQQTDSSKTEYNLTIKSKDSPIETDAKNSQSEHLSDIDDEMLRELNIESLSSESDDLSNGYTPNRQSPEELGVKMMLNAETTKFEIKSDGQISASQSAKPAEITAEKIIEQITKQFDSIKSTSRLNIVLNPESLGKVNLQILNTKDGLSAQFTVTTNDARELLMKGIDGLKESLLAQGVNVDNISVKISDTEEAYNPDWTEQESDGGEKGQKQQKQEEKEKGLFEKTIAKTLKNDDSNNA